MKKIMLAVQWSLAIMVVVAFVDCDSSDGGNGVTFGNNPQPSATPAQSSSGAALVISPATCYVLPNEAATFTGSGGNSPYSYFAFSFPGNMATTMAATGIYTFPLNQSVGTDKVMVFDSAFNSGFGSVNLIDFRMIDSFTISGTKETSQIYAVKAGLNGDLYSVGSANGSWTVRKSSNGGISWMNIDSASPGGSAATSIAFDNANSFIYVSGYDSSGNGQVRRSADSGITWSTIDTLQNLDGPSHGTASYISQIFVLPGTQVIWLAQGSTGGEGPSPSATFRASQAGGVNFATTQSGANLPSNTNYTLLGQFGGYVFRSYGFVVDETIDGVNWTNMNNNNSNLEFIPQAATIDASANIYAIGWMPGYSAVVAKTRDSTASWQVLNQNNTGNYSGSTINVNSAGHLYISGPSGVLKSKDGGNTWYQVSKICANSSFMSATDNYYLGTGFCNPVSWAVYFLQTDY